MNDRAILHRYARPRDESAGVNIIPEPDAPDDFGAFGWLRGIRDRALMLELRKKDGNIMAIGYGWLERAEFDPSEGITLCFVDQRIRIKGRNLNAEIRPLVRLFEGITRHRVPWIRETDRAAEMQTDGDDTVIETVTW